MAFIKTCFLSTFLSVAAVAQTTVPENSPGLFNETTTQSINNTTTTPGSLNTTPSTPSFDSRTPGIYIDEIGTSNSSTVSPLGSSSSAMDVGLGGGAGAAPGANFDISTGSFPGAGTATSVEPFTPVIEPITDDSLSTGSSSDFENYNPAY